MHNPTQGISPQALLEIANALLRQHDDYLAGVAVEAVSQQGDVLVFRGPLFWMKRGCQRQKLPRSSISLNTWRLSCLPATTCNNKKTRPKPGLYS